MQRKKIVIGNWKMNPMTLKEAEKLFAGITKLLLKTKKTQVVICPPFIYLEKLKKISKKISLGAQDVFWGEVGAYTGEVSGEMLYDLGTRYVILGHSERRAMGEKDGDINKKIKSSLASGLRPILCVGENIRDENHSYFNLVKTQLEGCLGGVSKDSISRIIIAYEPVWAISTTVDRKDATPEDFLEMSIFIRKIIADKFGVKTKMSNIIYGGSVNEKNVGNFVKHESTDGVLVGNASLSQEKFSKIVTICEASNS